MGEISEPALISADGILWIRQAIFESTDTYMCLPTQTFKVHIYGCAHHTQFHILVKYDRSNKSLF